MKTRYHMSIALLAFLCTAGVLVGPSVAQDDNRQLPPEKELITILQSSEASLHDKAKACEQLTVVGTENAIPVLAALLGDEKLGHYARYALEPMDDPEAGAALREALGNLDGRLRIGVVTSLGVRQDEKAVGALIPLSRDSNPDMAAAALTALGKIATPEAGRAILQVLTEGPGPMRPAAANGALICAERHLAEGNSDGAVRMYEAVQRADVPERYKAAAEKGIAAAGEPGAAGMAAEAPPEIKASEAKSMFDGKTFVGWEGDAIWFRVEDGAIVGGSLEKEIPLNKFLCATKEYDDFVLQLKVKLVENRGNAGIQIRSQRMPNHHEMIGYQADVGVGYWGKLYDESRRRKVLAGPEPEVIAKALKPNDWNDYVVRCEGPRIQIWINGVETVDYVEADESIPQKGLIGLQIHSGAPSEVWYKDIEIVELP